jgi:SAM-dependent methyltransferase
MVAILSNKREAILDAVRAMYTAVATEPGKGFHFPTGRAACEFVGYPAAILDHVSPAAVESFAGVGYPFAADVIRPGDVVLDIGAGSGTDTLIASGLVGARGKVYALDMTSAMRHKLRAVTASAGITNVTVVEGDAESIPLPDESVSIVTSNGVLNLVPDKRRAVSEIARVLRPEGSLQLADVVLASLPAATCRDNPDLWAECVVGATTEEAFLAMLVDVGLTDVEVLHRLDYFAASSSDETRKVAASFGAQSVAIRARKPASVA